MSLLRGVRILDMCYGLAGAMAGQILADQEADIVRIDLPAAGPRTPEELVRLRGRRSIVINPWSEAGMALLRRFIAGADVLLSEPGLEGRHPLDGLSYRELAGETARLVWCRLTGYGDEGPLAGYFAHDHLVAARYGIYSQPGWRPGPTFLTAPVPSLGLALLAAQAIGTALYQRERSGKGQEVTTSLLAGALALQPGISSAASAPPARAQTPPGPLGALPFYSLYECADGRWLHFGCLSVAFQERAVDALGLRAELTALGYGTPQAAENQALISEVVRRRMREKTYEEWAALLEANDVPYAPSQWTEDLLDDPQVRHEQLLVRFDDPSVGPMEQMGASFLVEGRAWRPPAPAPLSGQHTNELCRELGLGEAEIEHLRRSGAVR